MKITKNLINKIYNLEIKLTKEKDKYQLSKYYDLIPMYDIRSLKIYPIDKYKIYNYLILSDYRFINDGMFDWLNYLYTKYKTDQYKYNIDIMNNYNIKTLYSTSIKTLYKYSPHLELQISICKRESFHPYINHLNPYYTKLELIKLGQNKNLIRKNIELDKLLNRKIQYNLCMKISHGDVSYIEIENSHEYIYLNECIGWISYYSFIGSFQFNSYLRNKYPINNILINGINKIVKLFKKAPLLKNNYEIYRFVSDDEFISSLKIGEQFIEKGFLSTTRDPFYNPGVLEHFGLILIKINIPKDIKGLGLFIENYSLFPKEEELLLPPNTILKLKSKNDNFKYYHINLKFEKLINKKYEFDLINITYDDPINLHINEKYYNIDEILLNGSDKLHMIKQFIDIYSLNELISIRLKNKKYNLLYHWFNSTENSVYQQFYYNKINKGLLLSLIDNDGNLYLNIELGPDMCINYLNKFYIQNNIKYINKSIDFDLIYAIAKLFHYYEIIITHEFTSFIIFKNNYTNINPTYLIKYNFNYSIYNYLKTNEKYLTSYNSNYTIGYWYLDKYFNKPIDTKIELPDIFKKYKTYKELYINVVEKYFYYYNNLITLLDNKIFDNEYVIYNIKQKLSEDINYSKFIKPTIEYDNSENVFYNQIMQRRKN